MLHFIILEVNFVIVFFFLGGGLVLFQLCEYMIFLMLETEIVILDNFGRCLHFLGVGSFSL